MKIYLYATNIEEIEKLIKGEPIGVVINKLSAGNYGIKFELDLDKYKILKKYSTGFLVAPIDYVEPRSPFEDKPIPTINHGDNKNCPFCNMNYNKNPNWGRDEKGHINATIEVFLTDTKTIWVCSRHATEGMSGPIKKVINNTPSEQNLKEIDDKLNKLNFPNS